MRCSKKRWHCAALPMVPCRSMTGSNSARSRVRGQPEPLAALLRQGFLPGPKHPMHRLLEGDRFVQIPDLAQLDSPEVRTALAVEAGSRTLLCIPLRKDDALLGQIVAVRREVRTFSEKEIALLENFAAQADIAMENALLMKETH